jgi:hypothetical protein
MFELAKRRRTKVPIMNTATIESLRRQDNGSTIRVTTAPLFWPECGKCGAAMDLARIKTAPNSLHWCLRCPIDRVCNEVVFARTAGRRLRGPQRHPVTILAGPARFPRARCGCGREGAIAIVNFAVAHEVEFTCVLATCGHGFELHVPVTCDVDVVGVDHD